MYDNLSDKIIKKFFIGVFYKIMPNKFKPYKLFTIKGFNINNNKSVLCALILIKKEDEKTFFIFWNISKIFIN